MRAAAEIGHFRYVRLWAVVLACGGHPRGPGDEAEGGKRPKRGVRGAKRSFPEDLRGLTVGFQPVKPRFPAVFLAASRVSSASLQMSDAGLRV